MQQLACMPKRSAKMPVRISPTSHPIFISVPPAPRCSSVQTGHKHQSYDSRRGAGLKVVVLYGVIEGLRSARAPLQNHLAGGDLRAGRGGVREGRSERGGRDTP